MIVTLFVVFSIFIATYYTCYPRLLMNSIRNENENAVRFHLSLHGGINRLNYPKISVFENYTYYSPFSYACSIDSRPELLQMLISSGAQMEGDDWHFSGMYYLLTIKGTNNASNVELLIENGFDPNYIEYFQQPILQLSIEKMRTESDYDSQFHFEIYSILLENGATQQDKDIFSIVSNSNLLILQEHIQNETLDLDVTNGNGQTALMLASGANPLSTNVDIVTLLLEAGANASLSDLNGMTALDYAYLSGNQEIIDLLLAHE